MTGTRFVALGLGVSLFGSLLSVTDADAGKKSKKAKRAAAAAPTNAATESFSGSGLVFASVLNIRSGPGSKFRDIGNLYKGQRVQLLGRTKAAFAVPGYGGAYRWYRVRTKGGVVGWSWGGFLQVGAQTPPQRQPGGGHPTPAPTTVAQKPIEAFNDVGAVYTQSLNVRSAPSTGASIIGHLGYGKVARLTARTKFAYAIGGYRGSYRWYRVQVGALVGWSWGGFLSVGKKTPPQRNPGGAQPCDTRRANCHPHTPPGGGPGSNTPPQNPVPSAGAALSVFPVVGRHWSWNKQACGYNDYYTGTGTNHPNGHLGNDIFATIGTPLVAAVAGTVVRAGYGGSVGGNRVTIKRGNWYFYYAHMNSVSVRVGQSLKAGDRVGTLGKTGAAQGTEPHLHFSIYAGDNYNAGINPFPYAKKVDPQCR